MQFVTLIAEAANTAHEGSKGDLLSALGIDWRLLILQIIAFLLLVWLLGKYVYPWLMKSVDKRQADIEAAAQASKHSKEDAEKAKRETEALLENARREATGIIANAKDEAADLVRASESRAEKAAERIVEDARQNLEKEVEAAKKALYDETIELVAKTTEKVVKARHYEVADDALIASLLEESKS